MKKIIFLLLMMSSFIMANLYDIKCAACHGTAGEKQALGKSAVITGQDINTTIEQLTKYKSGELDIYGMGRLMKSQVSTLSTEDIEEMAKYINTLTTETNTTEIKWRKL